MAMRMRKATVVQAPTQPTTSSFNFTNPLASTRVILFSFLFLLLPALFLVFPTLADLPYISLLLHKLHSPRTSSRPFQTNLVGITLSTADLAVIQTAAFNLSSTSRTSTPRRTVVAVAATSEYVFYLDNLLCSIWHAVVRRPVVLFALDSAIARLAPHRYRRQLRQYATKLAVLDMHTLVDVGVPKPRGAVHEFATKSFATLTLAKLEAVRRVLHAGYDVVFMDLDLVVCGDIAHALATQLDAAAEMMPHNIVDVVMQSNMHNESHTRVNVNTGLYYARSTEPVLRMFDAVADMLPQAHGRHYHDQKLIYEMACLNSEQAPEFGMGKAVRKQDSGESLHKCVWNNTTAIAFLPLKKFPNGWNDPLGRRYGQVPKGFYGKECWAARISAWHVNFCVGKEKAKRLKEQDLWLSHPDGTCRR